MDKQTTEEVEAAIKKGFPAERPVRVSYKLNRSYSYSCLL